MAKYIDTHAHILKHYYKNQDISEIINHARKAGVKKIIAPAISLSTCKELLTLNHSNVFIALGIHPSEVFTGCSKQLEKLDLKKAVAIGEIGIDLYHRSNPPLEVQKEEFKKQLLIAIKNKLPAIIHTRESWQEVYEILSSKEFKGKVKFVMHSFTYNYRIAKKFLELGGYISFSGIVTFKNAKDVQECAKSIPLERIIIETDSPFLAPTPHRGKINYPGYVQHVGDFIAKLRDENDEKVLETIWKNSCHFFNI